MSQNLYPWVHPRENLGILSQHLNNYALEQYDFECGEGVVGSPKPIDIILQTLYEDHLGRTIADWAELAGMVAVYNVIDPASLEVKDDAGELPDGYDPLEHIIVYDEWGYYWGGRFVFTKEPTH